MAHHPLLGSRRSLAPLPEHRRTQQRGRLVERPEQPPVWIVEPAPNRMARGVVHSRPPSHDRGANEPGHDADPHASRDADADRAQQLHRVEAKHRADQRRSHRERCGKLPDPCPRRCRSPCRAVPRSCCRSQPARPPPRAASRLPGPRVAVRAHSAAQPPGPPHRHGGRGHGCRSGGRRALPARAVAVQRARRKPQPDRRLARAEIVVLDMLHAVLSLCRAVVAVPARAPAATPTGGAA